MNTDPTVLVLARGRGHRLREERRPASYLGPQAACHPDEVELCLLLDGVEHVTTGRLRDTVVAGQATLVDAGREHSSWTTTRAVHERILHIDRERLAALADDAGLRLPAELPHLPFALPPEVARATAWLGQELGAPGSPAGRDLLCDALLVAIWVPLLRQVDPGAAGAAPPAQSSDTDRRLRRVEACLRADLTAPHTLDGLAALAGLSRYHLLRLFKARYGLPPYAYLTRLRVERAADLARATDLALTQIAFDVGFGSSSRLTEAFRRHFGVGPDAWRRAERLARVATARSGTPAPQ